MSRLAQLARHRDWMVLVLIVAAIVLAPFSGSRFWVYNMTLVALYAIVVIGLNALVGQAGQVSFAQTSFMAVGGYGAAILTKDLGWNPWLAILAATVIVVPVALVIGIPMLRLRGHYLAMGTFALALGTFALATGAERLTRGAIGISGVPPLTVGGFSFLDPTAFYLLVWGVCGLSLLAVVMLKRSYVGRAWRALATREDVAASLGVGIRQFKTLAFVLAAVLGAIAGSLYVEYTSFVSPDLYDASVIVSLFVMLFIGGRGATFGPIIGAGVVILVPQLISGLSHAQNLVFDLIMLAVILLRPQGLLGEERGAAPLETVLPTWMLRRWQTRPT